MGEVVWNLQMSVDVDHLKEPPNVATPKRAERTGHICHCYYEGARAAIDH
jgi:hypothetical protein